MKRFTAYFLTILLAAAPALARDEKVEQERVKESGEVIKEILNIPDDIRQDLPQRPALHRQVGSSCTLCSGGNQHWIPTRRTSYRFRAPRNESQGRAFAALQ